LFISTRRDGRSLGEMAKQELGSFAGIVVMLGALGVMIIILAVLALVVVKALAHSPWGVFSIAATIPIALFMGVYMRYIRMVFDWLRLYCFSITCVVIACAT